MPDTGTHTNDKKTWTTWEELLLACAVKRHGLEDWDSVASELQMRSSFTLTAKCCETKYHDLSRRFTNIKDGRFAAGDDVDGVPWLDELRKLRVAELKQEVHRYDLSIQSLQSKVKRLQEERERSSGENENGYEKPDLEKDSDEARSETKKKDGEAVQDKSSPDGIAGRLVSGEDSGVRNRSSNVSSSTDNQEEDENRATEATETADAKPDPESKPVKEDSCNDSSDTIAKQSQEKRIDGDSGELRDSAAESKEGMKESSDVQSSASLTKQRRRRGEASVGGGGGGRGDEPVAASPATTIKRDEPGKADSLVEFLHIIRSHKAGSTFERRLDSQRTDAYKGIVRQHVDLETVHARVDDGSYSSSAQTFYLDLLLLFSNAVVFFPKSSQESIAAYQLRDLVLKEIKKKRTQQPTPSSDSTAVPLPKLEPERPEPLLDKQKATAPILVCRKRSNISSKATSSVNKVDKQSDEKPFSNLKPPVKSSPSTPAEDEGSLKLKMMEKPVTGVRSMRRSSGPKGSAPNVAVPGKNLIANPSSTLKVVDSGKVEKNKEAAAAPTTATKKRGAADFLKRIKKNSPAKPAVGESSKAPAASDVAVSGKREQKKRMVVEERRDVVLRKGGNGRQLKLQSSPSKRTIGRPPKKEKEVAPVPAKRARESTNEAEGSNSKRPKKRTRK